jgi:hypothetical protein
MGVSGGRHAVLATSAAGGEIRDFTPAELADLGLVDTKPPVATMLVTREPVPEVPASDWWWLLGLAGFVAVFLGASRIRTRD